MKRLAACTLALLTSAPAAGAMSAEVLNVITMHDQARLANYSAAREEAVAQARAAGAPKDVATLEKMLSAQHLSFEGFDMGGDWQCRVTKLGGLADLVIYSWFRCRVGNDGSGWALAKLTGSQRTTGWLFADSGARLIYLGSGSVNDEPAPRYGSGPDSDQAGYAFRTGRKAWRIEFSSPYYESKLDILELRR